MSNADPGAQFYLRDFESRDISPLTAILNSVFPDEPTTLEQQTHWERTYPAGNPRVRRVAETAVGQIVGYADCQHPFWSNLAGVYAVFLAVAPEWQGHGIGRALLATVTPFAVAQGATRLRASCKEDNPRTVRFLEKSGFARIGIRFEAVLDVQPFAETPFLPAAKQAEAAGYDIITLAQARQQDPEADSHLFQVYASTIVDVPFPGDERAVPNYDNFRAMLDAPTCDPNAIFIARHAGRMAGLTMLELLPNQTAVTGMTGVLREDRGRGVATALKLASLRYLKAHGYTQARTQNDTANPPILALNEKLGYRRLPGWLAWEKVCCL